MLTRNNEAIVIRQVAAGFVVETKGADGLWRIVSQLWSWDEAEREARRLQARIE